MKEVKAAKVEKRHEENGNGSSRYKRCPRCGEQLITSVKPIRVEYDPSTGGRIDTYRRYCPNREMLGVFRCWSSGP